MAHPSVIAALDVGTNSFHMIVAKVGDTGFEVITREKETVRLGRGSGEMRHLDDDAIERGVACLGRMRLVAESHDAEIRAVATSAVREARNRDDFLRRVRREAGIDIEVVSGIEEARLIHLGALEAVGRPDQTMLLCDVGGGSTEIVLGRGDEEYLARSFKLGAVRLTDRFFASERLHPSAVSSCRSHVRASLMAIQAEVAERGFDVAVASSGTAETVARLIIDRSGRPAPRSLNRYEFAAADLSRVVADLASHDTVDERRRAMGLEARRAEILLAGALILEGVADVFGVGTFTYSDYALREGLIIDSLRRHGRRPGGDDVAMRSVRSLAERCDDRPDHSRHVARIAGVLFDGLHERLGLDESSRRLLVFAALLANVGVFISHSRHHLHTYYVVRNSDLVGLSDHEIELVAQVARYHRKGHPKDEHPEFGRLDEHDKRIVRGLAAILRIAIGLDRTQDGRVRDVEVRYGEDEIRIEFSVGKKDTSDLNEYAANERRGLLEETSGRRVRVVAT